MRAVFNFAVALLLSIWLSITAWADEGMWLLDQLETLNWKSLKKRGLHLDPSDVRRLKDAVVIIDGGTGAFVSAKGLVLTNHHVAYGALQRVSSPDVNYLEEGFRAKNMSEEIPIPGYEVLVTRTFRDITAEVRSAVREDMSPAERFKALQNRKQEIEEREEAKEEGLQARVVEMYSGMTYYLFIYERFQDVRLVYAPPRRIGDYGGDIDNWMWPRHAGDFAFLRVYATKEGKPTLYSDTNVPYQPRVYLPISTEGVKEGDFTFILGYPGITYRYRTSYSVDYHINVNYPFQIEMFQTAIAVLEQEARKDPQTALSLSGFLKGLNNVLKKNQGMLDGFARLNLLEKKRRFETEFLRFLAGDAKLQEEYGTVLDEIRAAYDELRTYASKRNWLGSLRFVGLPNTVYSAYRYAIEKEKPESEREPGFSEKRIQERLKRLEYRNRQYVRSADVALLKAFLKKMAQLPEDQRPEFLNALLRREAPGHPSSVIDAYVDSLFANSRFKNLMDAADLFRKSRAEFETMNDPMIQFAHTYYQAIRPLEEKWKAFVGNITRLRSQYLKALFAWKGKHLYPDANRTLRFTYGEVRGYRPRDAVIYLPKTRLAGVVEKHTGKAPFDAPVKLLDLFNRRDFGSYADPELGDIPVNFLHTTDITGGNSGSPVLNGKGHLIGVAFDGNYEAMTSDYQFSDELTRTISVDVRYILFLLDKFSGATHILNELERVGNPK